MFRKVAAPGARAVVDDIHMGPGKALAKLERMGVINVLERFAFPKKTEHNPCQRKPKGRTMPCSEWGFAVAEYTHTRPRVRVATSAKG